MNRTDRLYAIVEELRAASPRGRSARWLAGHFEVSFRTIERDIDALRGGGIPIRLAPDRPGEYQLDPAVEPAKPAVEGAPVTALIEDAITDRRVLHLDYLDRSGTPTRRVVEPHGFVGAGERWYLIAWCRLREQVRGFRMDRIQRVFATDEPAEPRTLTAEDYQIPAQLLIMLAPPKPARSATRPRRAAARQVVEAEPPPRPRLYSVTTPGV